MSHSISHLLSHHIQLLITSSVFQQKFIPHSVAFFLFPYPFLLLLSLPHLSFFFYPHIFPLMSIPPLQLYLSKNFILIILYFLDSRVNYCHMIHPLFKIPVLFFIHFLFKRSAPINLIPLYTLYLCSFKSDPPTYILQSLFLKHFTTHTNSTRVSTDGS